MIIWPWIRVCFTHNTNCQWNPSLLPFKCKRQGSHTTRLIFTWITRKGRVNEFPLRHRGRKGSRQRRERGLQVKAVSLDSFDFNERETDRKLVTLSLSSCISPSLEKRLYLDPFLPSIGFSFLHVSALIFVSDSVVAADVNSCHLIDMTEYYMFLSSKRKRDQERRWQKRRRTWMRSTKNRISSQRSSLFFVSSEERLMSSSPPSLIFSRVYPFDSLPNRIVKELKLRRCASCLMFVVVLMSFTVTSRDTDTGLLLFPAWYLRSHPSHGRRESQVNLWKCLSLLP